MTDKPLIDRMAEALEESYTLNTNWVSGIEPGAVECKRILKLSVTALAEYHLRPTEISQETALMMLLTLRTLAAMDSPDYRLLQPGEVHSIANKSIHVAEAELKGDK